MPSSISRDNSQWVLPGYVEPLKKGSFLLAVYENYIADKLTLAEIQRVFQELSNKSSYVGNRYTYRLRDEITNERRFYALPICTADRQLIRVSTQWSFKNFPYVLKALHHCSRKHFPNY